MFTIHQSNSNLALVSLLQRNLGNEQPAKSVFEPDTILVQSFGIATWLKARIAEFQGIAANLECVLPAEFIWRVYREVLGDSVPETSSFSRDAMLWKLMSILPAQLDHPDYNSLAHYLRISNNQQLRLYQLCNRIAGVFDEYLVYRPDWIMRWHSGEETAVEDLSNMATAHEKWQRDLWQKLSSYTESLQGQSSNHRVKLHEMLLGINPDDIQGQLPSRVSVFGVSSMPPQQLDVLRHISSHCAIDIYLLNPCQMYWGDIVPAKKKAKLVARQIARNAGLAEEDYLMVGNPILSSMGQQTREFTDLLLDIPEAQFEDFYIEAEDDSMLHRVQNEILNLEFGGQIEPNRILAEDKFAVADKDLSIQIHSTHSPLREIEVLLDQLLYLFSQDQSLEARDVIVMMPDVSSYVPYIDSVFGARNLEQSYPSQARSTFTYSISDRSAEQQNPIISSLFSLLELPASRLAANDVLDLVRVPAISRRFNLDSADIETLHHWISQSGIRWGWDADSKESELSLPANGHNTWKFGLDRMLLGYAMDNSAGLFSGMLPYDGAEGGASVLLGQLLRIFERLRDYRKRLSKPLPIDAWQSLLNDMIEDFFSPNIEEDLAFNQVRDTLSDLADLASNHGFNAPIELTVLKYCLQQRLQQPGAMHGFLSGGITFCNLVPMRSIPFKIVCLLGMNDGGYPRRSPAIGFDLIRLSRSRKGDRSRRNDDRYLFLEALLSARQTFYLSYQGKSATSNRDRPPSVLVSDLIDSCKRSLVRHGDTGRDHSAQEYGIVEHLFTQHPLQPFNAGYFSAANERLISYSQDWYTAALKSVASRMPKPVFCAEPLGLTSTDSSSLEIDELSRFFRNPAQYFFNYRLGVYFTDPDEDAEDKEPFNLDRLNEYLLAQDALSAHLEGLDRSQWEQAVIASGRVLDGDMGSFQLDTPWQQAAEVHQQISPVIEIPADYLSVRVNVEQTLLIGEVKSVHGKQYLFYRTGKVNARQQLECWIRHLGLNASGHDTDLIISDSDQTRSFGSLDSGLATRLLFELASLYFQGLCQPLRFVPELSLQWQQGMSAGTDEDALLTRMATSINSGRGEVLNPYYRRAFDMAALIDDEFRELSATVYRSYIELQDSP